MEQLKNLLPADQSNLTNFEPEPFILTEKEKSDALLFAIDQAKKLKHWKLWDAGYKEEQILAKLSTYNFMEEINEAEILQKAITSKLYKIWETEQREKEKKDKQDRFLRLKEKCNYKYFVELMRSVSIIFYGKELLVNDQNKEFIKNVCLFMAGDESFNYNYDLKKGLLIRGVSGLGKTYVIKCIAHNEIKPINIVSMLDVANHVKDEGEYKPEPSAMLYLDDVGTEEHIINHYGTKINWFKDFIELYYMKNLPFNRLIISTNNSFQELEDKYGFRVRSRLKDMFNIINLGGKDMRG